MKGGPCEALYTCGGVCTESLPATPCPTGTECESGETCLPVESFNYCVRLCEFDSDCSGTCNYSTLPGSLPCQAGCSGWTNNQGYESDYCDYGATVSCPSGFVCGEDGGDPSRGSCYRSCTQDSECIATVIVDSECTAPVVACAVDGDCPGGWTCDTGAGQCTRTDCSVNFECNAVLPQPRPYMLSGVADVQSPSPVSCDGPSGSIAAISSSDALACVAQAEVAIGSPCAYLCGDGEIDPGETCDDGNALPGDGCDANCQLEP